MDCSGVRGWEWGTGEKEGRGESEAKLVTFFAELP